ncbi:MAG: DUF115 domain-containing protein [Clostridiales bacterium]|nr:DUF115 domain-containing protein [Roseburia sp.]MDD7637193.1 DUF115 domain-containing protein [Clostridiales bacterium]
MNILERNEQALKRLGEKFVLRYQSIKECNFEHCFVTETVNHQEIICQQRDGYNWRLNSIYEPEQAAEKYAMKRDRFNDYAIICVFGISDGRVVRRLCENCNGTQNLIIYEPDHENFVMAMKHFPLEDIIEKEWVHLIVEGINEEHLHGKLDELIRYENRNLVTECILPNYDVLYLTQGQDYIEKMLYCVKKHVFNMNTEVAFGEQLADNMLYSLPHILQGSSLNNLKSAIEKCDISGIPAIIVSAGPSLDKNIRQLRAVGNKAFIIGVDSALKALIREGIDFHIGISVDPRKNPAVFEDETINRYPLVLSANSIPVIAGRNRSRLFFQSPLGFEGFQEMLKEQTGEKLGELKTGGSVATDAFSLAEYLGFRQIILIGQDLAYTGGKMHVSGFAESEANRRDENLLVEVEGMDGSMLRTDMQMDSYRKWFELAIKRNEGKITVYNATEGGARIHGAIELTLQEAVEQLCNRDLDFPAIIKNAPKLLTENERITLSREFYALDSCFIKLKNQIVEGEEAYQTLIRLEESNGQNTREYQEVIRQIGHVNEIDEQEPFMNFIKLYAKQTEYAVAEDIYVAQELTVKEIAERGVKLLGGYEKGIEVAIEKVRTILKPALEKECSG